MPKRSYEDFAATIAQYQAAPTREMIQDLIADTFDVEAEDADEHVTDFALSRIGLAYRTGAVETHLRHLYDVLAVLERELAKA